MDHELNALIVNANSEIFRTYEEDLLEFGYTVYHCSAEASEITAQAIITECDIILLSSNDLESEDELAEIIEFFKGTGTKKPPMILNSPMTHTRKTDELIDRCSFAFNIFPTGEKRSIIIDIERNTNYKNMDCDKLFFLLKQKIIYDCGFIGINKNQEGYKWISEAVLLILTDSGYRKNFSAGVYKVLCNKYNATYTQIEPAIRRSMNDLYKRMKPLIRVYYFDLDANSGEKYTATHFINKIADNIKIQYKRNYTAFMSIADADRRKVINSYFAK